MLQSLDAIYCDPAEALDLYTRQCALDVTAHDLAVMGATLADGGVNPVTGERVVAPEVCHDVLAVMATAGMYETSGDWLYEVGLPGKSGIGGGIVTVSPGKGALATFSPPLAAAAPTAAPTAVASVAPAARMPLQEPAMSGADKFRWPVTGKVVTSFASSNDTGINISAPAGTPVKAVENGTVIYVGSGVEGYGNLVLIRHANGYVSAYANLKDASVAKGKVVGRGDIIGSVGATGSVSSPQLHFELRKGATPVDPVPLLAG